MVSLMVDRSQKRPCNEESTGECVQLVFKLTLPDILPPTSPGHMYPAWRYLELDVRYLRTAGLRNFLSTPWNGSHQIDPSQGSTLAYPPVIACRRLALKVAESVSSVAELTSTSILDNSMRAWSYCLEDYVQKSAREHTRKGVTGKNDP